VFDRLASAALQGDSTSVTGRYDLMRSAVALFAAFLAGAVAVSLENPFSSVNLFTGQVRFFTLAALTIWLPALEAFAILILAIWPSSGTWSFRRRVVSLTLAVIGVIVAVGVGRLGQIPTICNFSSDCAPHPIMGTAYHAWGWIALALVPVLLVIAGLPTPSIQGARNSSVTGDP
jgi:hypothetical protein